MSIQPFALRGLDAREETGCEVQQPGLAGVVVQPIEVGQHVACPIVLNKGLPVAKLPVLRGDELPGGQVAAELEKAPEQRNDAGIACHLIVADQGVDHDHVRPQIADHLAVLANDRLVISGSKVAVCVLALDDGIDPAFGLGQQSLVGRQHGQSWKPRNQ